jgi:hypothetical protein
MRRTFITLGLIVIAIGILWPWAGWLRLGHLPGDISWSGKILRLIFPSPLRRQRAALHNVFHHLLDLRPLGAKSSKWLVAPCARTRRRRARSACQLEDARRPIRGAKQ